MARYIGLMSGTSADGVDGVLADWDTTGRLQILGHVHQPFDAALRESALALNRSGADELHRAALVANGVARAYAAVVQALLAQCGCAASEVLALGAHGQTVRHQPGLHDGSGYTLQLLNAALLAEKTGIDVIADLRSRDVAAGGQGAPLVPALHAALFTEAARDVAVLNIGGIANLSLLPARQRGADAAVRGFDCGPGNALMDLWCERHTGRPYDADGAWAAQGRIDPALLARLLGEPYFAIPPPKSTGRDLFDAAWLDAMLARQVMPLPPQDVQATLTELTAVAAAQALRGCAPATQALRVCGGGTRNGQLMRRLAAQLPDLEITDTAAAGVPPEQVEAVAFAWLARAHLQREPGNLPEVTGACGWRVLGARYPGR